PRGRLLFAGGQGIGWRATHAVDAGCMGVDLQSQPGLRQRKICADGGGVDEFQMGQRGKVILIGDVRHSAILGTWPNKHSKTPILTDLSYKIKSDYILRSSGTIVVAAISAIPAPPPEVRRSGEPP